jgi:hypothetical protein
MGKRQKIEWKFKLKTVKELQKGKSKAENKGWMRGKFFVPQEGRKISSSNGGEGIVLGQIYIPW